MIDFLLASSAFGPLMASGARLADVPPAAAADLFSTAGLVALLTLTLLEIVLGIDNVIFIAILAGKLPREDQKKARQLGIAMALVTRVLLLLSITWVMRLTEPLFSLGAKGISGRDLILLVGGMFLIGKSTLEIHKKLEGVETGSVKVKEVVTMTGIVFQIALVDIVFSLDSVITAVGISGNIPVMVIAILIASAVMLFAAGVISEFVERHPTMKILALSFLILIGFVLVFEGWNPVAAHEHKLKNYAYFAMTFSLLVEMINMRLRPKAEPVVLRDSHLPSNEG